MYARCTSCSLPCPAIEVTEYDTPNQRWLIWQCRCGATGRRGIETLELGERPGEGDQQDA